MHRRDFFECGITSFSLSAQVSGWVWRAGSGVCLSLACPAHVPRVLWASLLPLTSQTEQGTSSWCGTLTRWNSSSSSTDTPAHRTRCDHFHFTRELCWPVYTRLDPISATSLSLTCRLWRCTASRPSASLSPPTKRTKGMKRSEARAVGWMKKGWTTLRLLAGLDLRSTWQREARDEKWQMRR